MSIALAVRTTEVEGDAGYVRPVADVGRVIAERGVREGVSRACEGAQWRCGASSGCELGR